MHYLCYNICVIDNWKGAKMQYSNYTIDQIMSPVYEEVAQKLVSLASDEDTKRKIERYNI